MHVCSIVTEKWFDCCFTFTAAQDNNIVTFNAATLPPLPKKVHRSVIGGNCEGDLIVIMIFWFALMLTNYWMIVFVDPLPFAPLAIPPVSCILFYCIQQEEIK